ncbi:hypothetical protein Fot_32326 [Forsythia ovata]|uniref:Uncharacterized protein n=1 Tax=Forsythia ovata TaxID=205694 RepID=A0ABD1T7H6_9LAMI
MASDVCRSEDLVRALMEYLVDPRLPFRFSANDTPDLSVQQAVAKQMYAVVLLYNYYHRKQHPELEFLDVVAFCDPKELNGIKDGLSVTEKAIRDACDISSALDTSKDVPNTEGWPISKVAVLLIDSKNENCLLQFAEKKVGNKRKRNSRKSIDEKNADDNGFLQLAFDAVKEVTGINSSDLVVLETHRVYSLSKEKTAALFYMMQCGSISESEGIPVEDVVNILQGPLVEKTCGSWTITPVVEYYHMHPYARIISHWFLRKCSSMPSLDGINSQSTKEITESIARNLLELKGIEKDLDHVDMHCQTIDNSCGRVANENSDSNNKKYKHSSSGKEASPVNIY